MQKTINETVELLKKTYKISVEQDYVEVQENILNAILNLKNINLKFPVENNLISDSNSVKIKYPETNINKTSYVFKQAVNSVKVRYDLRNTDKNNNKYYFYPAGESEFKNMAYNEGKIFVRVFHPDGKIEDTTRKVNKIWSSSVLWNINSMYSKYILNNNSEECHYSEGYNLKVYACPYSYKDTIPESV